LKWPPVNIGDRLVVLGRDTDVGRKSIDPAIILCPEERRGSFVRVNLIEPRREFALIAGLPTIIAAIVWLVARFSIPEISIELSLIAFAISIAFQGTLWTYLTRPRSYNIDESTWVQLWEMITVRFPDVIEVRFQP
jgi:hypothetical protein